MKSTFLKSIALLGALLASPVYAMKIAVTDLTYSDKVSQYFHNVEFHSKESLKARHHDRDSDYSSSSSDSINARSQIDYKESSGTYNYIEYGELRKFVGDIKGELLNSGFQVVQAKPYTAKGSEKIFDIIDRIKKGYYPHADYVLFGTVSDLEFRDEANPIIGTSNMANTFSLMLVAEFSLINTKTYEVKSAFSATGEGQDVRMVSAGSRVTPSRAKIIAEVSKDLGVDVASQINQQLGNSSGSYSSGDREYNRAYPTQGGHIEEGEVMRFSQ